MTSHKAIVLVFIALAFWAGRRTQASRQAFEDYRGYMAKAARVRWLRFRLLGVAAWVWVVIAGLLWVTWPRP